MLDLQSAWASGETMSQSAAIIAAKRLIQTFHSIEPCDWRA
jgi:hypothetical protein